MIKKATQSIMISSFFLIMVASASFVVADVDIGQGVILCPDDTQTNYMLGRDFSFEAGILVNEDNIRLNGSDIKIVSNTGWLNVTIDVFDGYGGDELRNWTENCTVSTANTNHIISGFNSSAWYSLYVDDTISTVLKSTVDGVITFNYSNGFSSHTFGIKDSEALVADFAYTPSAPLINERITFTDRSSGDIRSQRWSFGDGTAATGELVHHAYEREGFYRVTLRVMDLAGNSDTCTKTVTVGSGLVVIPPLQPPKYPRPPFFSVPEMYALLRANIPSSAEVVIVVIDSGNYPRTYEGVDLTSIIDLPHASYRDGIDEFGHGTWVNYAVRYGIQTYCPNAIQYSIRAFDGKGQSTPDIFLQCLDMAKDLNPDIVTISAGIIGTADDVFSKKVSELRRAGIFVIVSAGNSGPQPSTVTSPATGADAVAIGATDPLIGSIMDLSDDEVTEWSSRGPIIEISPKPDFAAPGESIAGPWLQGEKIASGTSMAAPLVASCVLQIMASNKGLLDAVQLVYGNQVYLDLIETSLIDSAYDKGDPNSYGWGIPNTQLATQHAWLKAVWYLAVFVLSIVVLMVSIFLVWSWTGGRKKK